MYGICTSRSLVCSEVIEVRSNDKDLACGDLQISLVVMSLGVIRLKKTELVHRLELFWEGG